MIQNQTRYLLRRLRRHHRMGALASWEYVEEAFAVLESAKPNRRMNRANRVTVNVGREATQAIDIIAERVKLEGFRRVTQVSTN